MKKKRNLIVVIMMMIFMSLMSGCGTKQEPQNDIDNTDNDALEPEGKIGVIIHKTDGSAIILETSEDGEGLSLVDVGLKDVTLTDNKGVAFNPDDLATGMLINVSYDGQLLETYPTQIQGASKIEVVEQTGDMIGMYLKVIDELYKEDSGLNSDIHTIALDLTQVNNLTEDEKEALVYLVRCNYDVDVRCATIKELEEEGLIKDLYYEDGIVFIFSDSSVSDGSFSFKAQKWRSGLGAIGYDNCKAYMKDNIWQYELSGAWIS